MTDLCTKAEIYMDKDLTGDDVQMALEIMDEGNYNKLAGYIMRQDIKSAYKLIEQQILDWVMEQKSYE